MTIIQTAKDLLKKGIKLNDHELILLANHLLESLEEKHQPEEAAIESQPKTKTAKAAKKTKATKAVEVNKVDVDQFVMQPAKASRKKREPLKIQKRVNQFQDDGTLANDEENITPKVKPTKRDRPRFKKVEQICQYCKASTEVHPTHIREFYICDSCLANRAKGR
jgi:hypothetical protein